MRWCSWTAIGSCEDDRSSLLINVCDNVCGARVNVAKNYRSRRQSSNLSTFGDWPKCLNIDSPILRCRNWMGMQLFSTNIFLSFCRCLAMSSSVTLLWFLLIHREDVSSPVYVLYNKILACRSICNRTSTTSCMRSSLSVQWPAYHVITIDGAIHRTVYTLMGGCMSYFYLHNAHCQRLPIEKNGAVWHDTISKTDAELQLQLNMLGDCVMDLRVRYFTVFEPYWRYGPLTRLKTLIWKAGHDLFLSIAASASHQGFKRTGGALNFCSPVKPTYLEHTEQAKQKMQFSFIAVLLGLLVVTAVCAAPVAEVRWP